MEQLITQLTEYANVAFGYLRRPDILFQLGMVIVLFLPAWLLSTRVEPALEKHVRKISGMPQLLRVLAAFLRRLEWLFYVILLSIAYMTTKAVGWPENNYLIYAVMLLAGAWLAINVVSHAIHSRLIGRLFAIVVWTFVAASVLGITDDIVTTLDEIGFSIGNVRLSLLRILQSVVFIGGLLWAAFAAGNFVDRRIQKVDELTPSLRVLLGKILRIAFIVFAVMIAMQSLSIDLTALTVLSGAVGVGIGFGLQKVVSNLISGVILLMDKSVKPGDVITLGETYGWINTLGARYASVVTRDGTEYLIPNEDIITQQVVNWSYSNNEVRLKIPIGISYKADVRKAIALCLEAAAEVERVVDQPKSVCLLKGFGDSSVDLELRIWINDPQNGVSNVKSQVLLLVWDKFHAHDIEIPFPQRDLHIRSAEPVPVVSKAAS